MNFWQTVLTGISDPKLCLVFEVHSLHAVMCSVTLEIQGLNPPGQGDEEDASGFTKTFSGNTMRIPNYLASYHCGLAFTRTAPHPSRITTRCKKRWLAGNVNSVVPGFWP